MTLTVRINSIRDNELGEHSILSAREKQGLWFVIKSLHDHMWTETSHEVLLNGGTEAQANKLFEHVGLTLLSRQEKIMVLSS